MEAAATSAAVAFRLCKRPVVPDDAAWLRVATFGLEPIALWRMKPSSSLTSSPSLVMVGAGARLRSGFRALRVPGASKAHQRGGDRTTRTQHPKVRHRLATEPSALLVQSPLEAGRGVEPLRVTVARFQDECRTTATLPAVCSVIAPSSRLRRKERKPFDGSRSAVDPRLCSR